MRFLSVNFHYIGDENQYKKGIYPISPERFEKQLNELGKAFDFISGEDLALAIDRRRSLPENSCLITFDDGLACQFEGALPVLDRKGIPAMFFANSFPYVENDLLTVHKIHHLLSQMSDADFCDQVGREMELRNINIENSKEDAAKKYRYDNPEIAAVKYVLNVMLDEKIRTEIINKIFAEFTNGKPEIFKDWYLSTDALKNLAERKYLGLHSHNHVKMAGSVEEIVANISLNKKIIEGIAESVVVGLSYPYGNKQDINGSAESALQGIGIKFAFTMERAFNTSLNHPLLLARADTNDVPGGKSPCFELKNREIVLKQNFSISRRLFFDEPV